MEQGNSLLGFNAPGSMAVLEDGKRMRELDATERQAATSTAAVAAGTTAAAAIQFCNFCREFVGQYDNDYEGDNDTDAGKKSGRSRGSGVRPRVKVCTKCYLGRCAGCSHPRYLHLDAAGGCFSYDSQNACSCHCAGFAPFSSCSGGVDAATSGISAGHGTVSL